MADTFATIKNIFTSTSTSVSWLQLRHCDRSSSHHTSNIILVCRIWGSHSYGYEYYYLPGYSAFYSVESQPTFRRNISPPSSRWKNKPIKKQTAWKQVANFFHAGFCSGYSSTQKMEAICSSERYVDFQRTTLHYIPEDSTLLNHRFIP
jgi:hypothetical protein